MRITSNKTSTTYIDGPRHTILFSYETCVAVIDKQAIPITCYETSTFHSATTRRHIATFKRECGYKDMKNLELTQDFFDNIDIDVNVPRLEDKTE